MKYEQLENLGYNPGGFKLSKKKLQEVYELLNFDKNTIKKVKKNLKGIKSTLLNGDTQMAKVINYSPLLIAIYSDEFDGVLILKFPDKFVEQYDLSKSKKMVCVNSYWPKGVFSIVDDIIPGDNCSYEYRDIIPFVPLFLTDDENRCEEMTKIFSDKHWEYFEKMIKEYEKEKPEQYRDGFNTLVKY